MHDLPFADAIRPAAVRVLQLLMLPYSVGHELILLRQRNPLLLASAEEFARLNAEEQRFAIIAAADVCSQGWAEYHAAYTRWQQHRLDRIWRKWRKAIHEEDYAPAIATWRNYRQAGSADFPTEEMPHTGGDFRYFGQPELVSLLNFLAITLRFSEAQVFDYPLGLARMRRLAWLESEGAVRITNAAEAEIARRREEYYRTHPEPQFELNPKDE
jgi:hypothetical protein